MKTVRQENIPKKGHSRKKCSETSVQTGYPAKKKTMREKQKKYNLNTYIAKSNPLIEALQNTTLFESKLRLLAEMNIQKLGDGEVYESRIPGNYIKSLMGISHSSGKINDMLLEATLNIAERKLIIRDRDTNTWVIVNFIMKATYSNSELVIVWNPEMAQYIYNIKTDYTRINREMQLSLNSNYSYKLYELLMRNAFHKKNHVLDKDIFHVTFSIAELRVRLGVVNVEDVSIQSYLIKTANKCSDIDFDQINALDKKQKYKEYKEFNRSVISKAVREINESEKSDIHVTAKKITGPPSGKVIAIEFTIRKLTKHIEPVCADNESFTSNELDSNHELLKQKVSELINESITEQDINSLLKKSDYDIERIKKAYSVAKASKKQISNLTGFLIKALEEDYSIPVTKNNFHTGQFNNFPQRAYDYDELEKKLLSKT